MGWFNPFYGTRSASVSQQVANGQSVSRGRRGTSSPFAADWGVKKRVDRETKKGRRRKILKSFVLGAAAGFGVGMGSAAVGTAVAVRTNQVWAMLAGIGTSIGGTALATRIGATVDGLDYKASAIGFAIGGTLGTATYLYGKFPTKKDFWKSILKGTAKFAVSPTGTGAFGAFQELQRESIRRFVPGGEWALNEFDELVNETADYVIDALTK